MYRCIRCGGVVGKHYFTSDQFRSAIDKTGEITGTPEFLGNHDVGERGETKKMNGSSERIS